MKFCAFSKINFYFRINFVFCESKKAALVSTLAATRCGTGDRARLRRQCPAFKDCMKQFIILIHMFDPNKTLQTTGFDFFLNLNIFACGKLEFWVGATSIFLSPD
jgi:hypothetical protein